MRYLIIFAGLTLLLGCQKSETASKEFEDEIVVTGFDYRLCPCCGGFMINFEDNETPYEGDFKLADNFPEGIEIDGGSTFPIYAKINWTALENGCPPNNRIVIDEMELTE